MKLYTKTGDDGSTGLIGGSRVSKSDPTIEACGSVDEANTAIGLAVASCDDEEMGDWLRHIQSELFSLGAELATVSNPKAAPRVDASHVAQLERWIDGATGDVPPLRNFILPGGCETAARLHHARAVCRRAERAVVALADGHPVGGFAVAYLNRLSDLLFGFARLANQRAGTEEVPWIAPRE